MDLLIEQVRKFTPSINYSVQVSRFLQVEAWAREWQTKSSRSRPIHTTPLLQNKIRILLETSREEIFEDGMESQLTTELDAFLDDYGNYLIDSLIDILRFESVNAEVSSEVLRWIGRTNHQLSYYQRLSFLEENLNNSSPRVRDAASLGLAYLNDPHAIPYIKDAIKRETCTELREDMEQVLSQLETAA
jgi:hypothetical protein